LWPQWDARFTPTATRRTQAGTPADRAAAAGCEGVGRGRGTAAKGFSSDGCSSQRVQQQGGAGASRFSVLPQKFVGRPKGDSSKACCRAPAAECFAQSRSTYLIRVASSVVEHEGDMGRSTATRVACLVGSSDSASCIHSHVYRRNTWAPTQGNTPRHLREPDIECCGTENGRPPQASPWPGTMQML